jgi:signal transduction histidine kinase
VPRRFKRRWSLAAKLTLTITSLVMLLVVAITLLSVRRERENFQAEYRQQAELVLDTLLVAAADALYLDNVDFLEDLMEELSKAQTHISGRVYDPTGRLIADSEAAGQLTYSLAIDPYGQQLVRSDAPVFDWQPDFLVAGKAAKFGRQRLGAISVKLSTAPLNASLEAVSLQGAGVALVAGLVGVVLALVISSSITEPLRELTAATKRIASGDLSHAIKINTGDELALLADDFTTMTVQLRGVIQNLQGRAQELAALNTVLQGEITTRKKVESELELLILELKAANEKALEASRLKSEFLATMSHELRTPLNAVIGYSGILLEGIAGELNDNTFGMVDAIYRSAEHLLELINSVLDIAKIEAGHLEIDVEPMSLRQATDEWQKSLAVLANRKGVDFDLSLAPAMPEWVYGDRKRISQIVINLLSNAVKFTKEGHVKLDLSWQNECVVIAVSDTGIGIPPDALDYIFDDFRQVDGTYKRAYEGTGLGLAIVRKLCLAMDGDISVSSKLGEGSTFIVKLPLKLVSPQLVTMS